MVFDDVTLACMLRTSLQSLWYTISNPRKAYTVFKIRTSATKIRTIHAPSLYMKWLGHRLLKNMLNPLQASLGDHVTAYRSGRGIPDAVRRHIPYCPVCESKKDGAVPDHPCPRSGVAIHIDLKDFFHNTKRSWIRRYFKSLGYSHDVAGYLAALCTCPITDGKGLVGVPQGSPVSGAICNLVANQRLDKVLLKHLDTLNENPMYRDEYKWVYSRYSDDLCFTSGHNLSKAEIKDFIRDINRIISSAGYLVNVKKTRWSHKGWRKHLLGANMTQHLNPDPRMYKRVRGILHRCILGNFEEQKALAAEKFGIEDLPSWLFGQIGWIGQLNPAKGAKLRSRWDALQEKLVRCP